MEMKQNTRRNFLKKAAYVAPAVVAMGALTIPKSAHASYVFVRETTTTNSKGATREVDVYKENDGSGDVKKIITVTKPNGKVVVKEKIIKTKVL